MTRKFVAINDPLHALLRRLTRETPLAPVAGAGGRVRVEYQVRPEAVPDEYFALAAGHALDGLPYDLARLGGSAVPAAARRWILEQANYFDAVRLDRRCLRDLRLKPAKLGRGLLAGELLSFGIGVLRARTDAPAQPEQFELRRTHGRLQCSREKVYARIRALSWNSLPLLGNGQTETFDSTNLVYGDTCGELEQLWERRADIDLLEAIAHSLQALRRHGQVDDYLCPPLNRAEVVRLHLSHGLWKTPPANGRALLRRLEKILANLVIDDAPRTVPAGLAAHADQAVARDPDDTNTWEQDRSGYDGWLRRL